MYGIFIYIYQKNILAIHGSRKYSVFRMVVDEQAGIKQVTQDQTGSSLWGQRKT